MALQVEVIFDRARDISINDEAGRSIMAPVSVLRISTEESHVVSLSDDDKRQFWRDFCLLTGTLDLRDLNFFAFLKLACAR